MKSINQIIHKLLKEATGDSTGARGSYILPMQPGFRPWKDSEMGPYTKPVSKYDSPLLAVDSYDGSMDERLSQIKKLESQARKITDYIKKHPYSTFSDDDGNIINPTFRDKLHTVKNSEKLAPFTEKVKFNEWVEISDKGVINEDLAVWFGKKKKPKGSSQPKGPWVDICRKVDGKHPPCGRSDTSKDSYPKCRAAGVAGKMSDSEKRSACQQKRNAEKKDTQTGKGQKPIMTSYKPRKKTNENMKRIVNLTEMDLQKIVMRVLKEQEGPLNISDDQNITLECIEIENIGGTPFVISGTIDVNSQNAAWGYHDPDTDQYVEPNKVVPKFTVYSEPELGSVTGDEQIAHGFYIVPITKELQSAIGGVTGNVIEYFIEGGPGSPNSQRAYCKVKNVTDQFKTELITNGVSVY